MPGSPGELHDEVNQSLSALLLRLWATREKAPPELIAELAETRAVASNTMEELLGVATRLRPTALDDLGLRAALELLVADDGRGFSVESSGLGLGVSGMRERALLVDGELELDSHPGRGTRVRLVV